MHVISKLSFGRKSSSDSHFNNGTLHEQRTHKYYGNLPYYENCRSKLITFWNFIRRSIFPLEVNGHVGAQWPLNTGYFGSRGLYWRTINMAQFDESGKNWTTGGVAAAPFTTYETNDTVRLQFFSPRNKRKIVLRDVSRLGIRNKKVLMRRTTLLQ